MPLNELAQYERRLWLQAEFTYGQTTKTSSETYENSRKFASAARGAPQGTVL